MTGVKTKTFTVSVSEEVAEMIIAFTKARNGSFHNAVDECLRAGVNQKLSEAPAQLQRRYEGILASKDT